MKRSCSRGLAWKALVLLLAVGNARAADPAAKEGAAEPAKPTYAPPPEAAAETAVVQVPIYVPPELGFPGGRVGASTRGAGRKASLQLLAPDHVGLTAVDQPTLYWYVAQPTTERIDITIRDENSIEPLLKLQLPKPTAAGVHALRLSEHGVKLRPDTNYQWFVSIVPEPEQRSKDFVVGAWVRYHATSAVLRDRLAAASDPQRVFLYAENGVWYDALAAISEQIARNPRTSGVRAQRAALLEQVGLSEVAAHDREVAGER